MQKNLAIQALRGIAAVAVVIFHCSALLDAAALEKRASIYGPLAYGGVDLFFLISGYIIASSVARTKSDLSSAAAFLLKRLIRVWPPYAIATAIFCVAFALKNPSAPSFSDISRSLLFIQLDSAAPYYGFAALVVGWTLNYEMFFYAVVAAGLLFRNRWAFVLALFVTLLVGVPLWLKPDLTFVQLFDANRADANSWVFTNPLGWLFLIGAAVHFVETKNLTVASGLVATLLVALSLAPLTAPYLLPGLSKHGLTGMGLAVIPFFAAVVLCRRPLEAHVPKWLVSLGDSSFSLYLTHVITLSVVNAALARYIDKGVVLMFAAVCTSIVGGALYYSFVERPLTRWLNARAFGQSRSEAVVVK